MIPSASSADIKGIPQFLSSEISSRLPSAEITSVDSTPFSDLIGFGIGSDRAIPANILAIIGDHSNPESNPNMMPGGGKYASDLFLATAGSPTGNSLISDGQMVGAGNGVTQKLFNGLIDPETENGRQNLSNIETGPVKGSLNGALESKENIPARLNVALHNGDNAQRLSERNLLAGFHRSLDSKTGQTETINIDISEKLSTLSDNNKGVRLSSEILGALNLKELRVNSAGRLSSNSITAGEIIEALGSGPESKISRANLLISEKPVLLDEAETGKHPDTSGVLNDLIEENGKNGFRSIFDFGDNQGKIGVIENTGLDIKGSTDAMPFVSGESSGKSVEISRLDTSQIRFVLPSEFQNDQAKLNRTVVVKMEPEHLGTVRLTLSSLNENLTARLIVDSVAARAAVESNLNNLIDQLDRLGIKVDQFEVSVSGEQVDSRAGEHKPPRTINHRTKRLDAYKAEPGGSVTAKPGRRSNVYISATGVNCFA
jgi:hypothetical protein